MAGLMAATALKSVGDGFVVDLDRAWEIWGPAGGYLAAIALRAVGQKAASGHRPVTLTGQFVSVAKPGQLDVRIEAIRQGGAALYAVTLAQGAQIVFLAQVWTTARNTPPIPIALKAPDVPRPLSLRPQDEIVAERGLPQNPFWKNMDGRPVSFRTFDDPPAEDTHQYRWMRLRDWQPTDDLFLDAMRTALLIDLGVWPGHWHRLSERAAYLAPSLDLTVHFHSVESAGDWLLSDADSDVSGNGLISGRVRMWSEDGRVLATGSGHCLVTMPKANVA